MTNVDAIAEIGGRYSTPPLLSQTDYFITLLTDDAAEVKRFGWTPAKTAKLESLREAVARLFSDKRLAMEDTVESTQARDRLVGDAKVWMAQVAEMAANAFALDEEKRDDFRVRESLGRSVPRITTRLSALIAVTKKYLKALTEWGITSAFVNEGQRILADLRKAGAEAKTKSTALPEKTLEFYRTKGELYLAIKAAQRCGRATFKRKPLRAARYAFEILYRRAAAPTRSKKIATAATPTA